jgi:hypothetical protein
VVSAFFWARQLRRECAAGAAGVGWPSSVDKAEIEPFSSHAVQLSGCWTDNPAMLCLHRRRLPCGLAACCLWGGEGAEGEGREACPDPPLAECVSFSSSNCHRHVEQTRRSMLVKTSWRRV